MLARQWTLAAYPQGRTRPGDFALVESELPPLCDGEALVRVGVVGLAPSLRFRMTRGGAGLPGMEIGDPIVAASGVGVVLDSRRDGVREGDIVYGDVGWCDHANIGPGRYLVAIGRSGEPLRNPRGVLGEPSLFEDGTYRPEDYIGLLGGGATAAWIGLRLTSARAGETVVITTAAGGIGSMAVQIAAQMGLDVVAITRSAKKLDWLREVAGVKHAVAVDGASDLEAVPDGYDVLFENAGGPLFQPLLARIAKYGRVALCGLIGEYETGTPTPLALAPLVFRNVSIFGYFADDHLPLWGPALDTLGRWLHEGRLRRGYEIATGLEALPQTYLRLFDGETNRGKLMLSVAEIA